MNKLSFDVEVINGNTDYIYRFRNDIEKNQLNEFAHRMILNNNIRGFIPYIYEISDEQRRLRYSIAPQITLSDYLKNRFTDISACVSVITNILAVIKIAEEYMIDRRFILFDADYIFINRSDNYVSVMCIPVNNAESVSLSDFMRSIVMPMNTEGVLNGDTLKVNVYQYDFDKEPIEAAIKYFSDFVLKPVVETNSNIKNDKCEQEEVKPQAEASVKSFPFVKKNDFLEKPDEIKAESETVKSPKSDKIGKSKGKKNGLFSGLFDSGSKKAKDKPSAVMNANPFEVNMPGQKTLSKVYNEAVPMNNSAIAPVDTIAESNSSGLQAMSYMKVENDEETVFETQDEGTVFLGNRSACAQLKDNTGAVFVVSSDSFSIGRSGKSGLKIDLDLQQKTVSHLHAVIYNENGNYYISDKGSANGTFVNNKRLSPNDREKLTHGARVRISNIDFIFELI